MMVTKHVACMYWLRKVLSFSGKERKNNQEDIDASLSLSKTQQSRKHKHLNIT